MKKTVLIFTILIIMASPLLAEDGEAKVVYKKATSLNFNTDLIPEFKKPYNWPWPPCIVGPAMKFQKILKKDFNRELGRSVLLVE